MSFGLFYFLVGLGVAIVTAVLYRLFPKFPRWADWLGFGLGLVLIAIGAIGWWQTYGNQYGAWPATFVYSAVVAAIIFATQRLAIYLMTAREVQAAQPQNPNSSGRSAEQIIQFVNGIKGLNQKFPVKVVAIDDWLPFARMLADAFRLAGYEVLINERNSTWVFSATTRHERVIFRSRPENVMVGAIVYLGLSQLATCDSQDFPDTDTHNFMQIEVGGSP
jgi:MFS family permease